MLSNVFRTILDSTEVISLNIPTKSKIVGNLNEARKNHGLAIVDINNIPTLLAFGGLNFWKYLDSIEQWNPHNNSWTILNIKLSEGKYSFGYNSIPKNLICT